MFDLLMIMIKTWDSALMFMFSVNVEQWKCEILLGLCGSYFRFVFIFLTYGFWLSIVGMNYCSFGLLFVFSYQGEEDFQTVNRVLHFPFGVYMVIGIGLRL